CSDLSPRQRRNPSSSSRQEARKRERERRGGRVIRGNVSCKSPEKVNFERLLDAFGGYKEWIARRRSVRACGAFAGSLRQVQDGLPSLPTTSRYCHSRMVVLSLSSSEASA